MGIISSVFGDTSRAGSAKPPNGTSAKDWVKNWLKDVEADRGAGYAPLVSLLVAHYRGQGKADTQEALKRLFPATYDTMQIVTLPLLRKLVTERARVFGGEGEVFAWLDNDGAPDEQFAAAVEAANVAHTLKAIDRLVELAGRVFVRLTWDESAGRVRLTVFTPDVTFPRWPADTRDIDACDGVLFSIDPLIEGGKRIERWEFWSPTANAIIDGNGRTSETPENYPYRYADKSPCVPIVSFGAESDDVAGYWLPPREDLLDTQRNLNADATNLMHLSKIAGYGINVSESSTAGGVAEPWPERTVLSPLEILEVPNGRTFTHTPITADFAGLGEAAKQHLAMVTALNDLPPGSVLDEGRVPPSGVALSIERAPLMEVRQDRADAYRQSVARLLEVLRVVHNTHAGAGEEIGEGRPHWTPGDVSPPRDPEVQRRLDEADIRIGVSSAVRVLMRDSGLTRDEAQAKLQEIREDGLPPGRPGNTPASMGNAGGAGAASAALLMAGVGKSVSFFQYEIEGGLVTINEVRASKGLPPMAKDGDLTLPEFRAKYPEIYAASTVTQTGGSAEKIMGMDEATQTQARPGSNPFLAAPASPLAQTRGNAQ